jgi:hypothetical protein
LIGQMACGIVFVRSHHSQARSFLWTDGRFEQLDYFNWIFTIVESLKWRLLLG